MGSATAITDCVLLKIDKKAISGALHREHAFSDVSVAYLREQLMAELGFELWIGDAAAISRKRVRKQETDKQDAELLLRLLMEDRFPRIWVPSREDRDLRQLLWHRHRLVQMQTRLRNQLHAALSRAYPTGMFRNL
jgi:transposase